MRYQLATDLMIRFAENTGVTGDAGPRRYLWTDAFAVCNFLGLAERTGETLYRDLARKLVDQVHETLGRHRDDDVRTGWISGLSEEEGRQAPTRGGLRIGKPLSERGPDEPLDERAEWDRDGQYFHYLTKWMHALHRLARHTGDLRGHRWACDLAAVAHERFTFRSDSGTRRLMWKMSIDLSRPQLPSTGQHDPLDALITYLELNTAESRDPESPDLSDAIAEASAMCQGQRWGTTDPLGIGGLLSDAARLIQMIAQRDAPIRDLADQLLRESQESLQHYLRVFVHDEPAEDRLAFRELGLAIGLRAVDVVRPLIDGDADLAAACDRIRAHYDVAAQIEGFWAEPAHRESAAWRAHRDINMVMLSTALAPGGFTRL